MAPATSSEYELINKNLEDIKKKLKKLDTMEKSMTTQSKDIKSLMTEMASVKQENANLKTEVNRLNYKVDELEQYGRRNNVEIHGIPEIPAENLPDILTKIGEKLGCEIQRSDIDVIHRLPGKDNKPRPVIARLVRRSVRDALLKERFKLANVKTHQLDINVNEQNKIFINENLTPDRRKLFYLTRQKKDEKDYKFAWIRNGLIFLRKTENSEVIKVTCMDDLDEL